ncbi:MAG: ribonuclease III [Planctomycetota bacterium]
MPSAAVPLQSFHTFSDPALAELALTHASAGISDGVGKRDNERLEFLGDTVLDLVIAEALFGDRARYPEGTLTEMKAQVVSRRALAGAAQRIGLPETARVGRGLDRRALSRSVLANLYEALVGAIYLDAGLEAAREFVLDSLMPELAEARSRGGRALPKQAFQEVCQRTAGAPPSYEVQESRGDDNARAFLVRARVKGRSFPPAWGRTVKEAEHWAAFEALLALGEDVTP